MSSNVMNSLQFAIEQVNIYMGFIALVSGVIGNILNIVIFLSLKTFRETSCATYLISASIVGIAQLLNSLMSRILISGYHIDLTQTSIFLCKFRTYFWSNCCLLWLTCMCFATIDQYASLTNRWNHLCNVRIARLLVIIAIMFWFLHGIPFLVFNNIYLSPVTNQPTCGITSLTFSVYHSRFVFPILLGFLPIVIRVSFGLLSFVGVRNLAYRQVPIVRSERDKQLTSMVLVQVLVDVILTLPYVIYYIYYTNAVFTDSISLTYATLIYTITVILYYSSGSASFYIYCCSSSRFRKQLIYVLIQTYIKRCQQRVHRLGENQVIPEAIPTERALSTMNNIDLR